MTPLERRIVATIARAARRGLSPSSFYLNPADAAELGEPEEIGGVPARRTASSSRLYLSGGQALALRLDRPGERR